MIKPSKGNILLDWSMGAETTTESGLVIAGEQKRSDFATVVAVCDNSELSVGDKVVFDKMKGNFIEYNNKPYLMTKEVDIYGVLEV